MKKDEVNSRKMMLADVAQRNWDRFDFCRYETYKIDERGNSILMAYFKYAHTLRPETVAHLIK